MNMTHAVVAAGATILLSTVAFAQTIDQWEPVHSESVLPSCAAQSDRTPSAWLGYSDGAVYFTSYADVDKPSWTRMDKGTMRGGPFDMGFSKTITAIASADSYDEYYAYVAMHSEKYYSQLYRVMYSRNGIHWTNLSDANFVGIQGVSVNPIENYRVYVTTSQGVRYSLDSGTTWQSATTGDPLTPPSNAAISAVAATRGVSQRLVLVGCDNGEIWSVTGAQSPDAKWTRLDQSSDMSLPHRAVTRIQMDPKDQSGQTFLVVYGGSSDQSVWLTRSGVSGLHALETPVLGGGYAFPTTLSASFSPMPNATTVYAQYLNFGVARSDDDGRTWFQRQ